MRQLRILKQRARALFRRGRMDDELRREFAWHLDQLTRENLDAGMEPRRAREAAVRAMGGVTQHEEACRDQRRVAWLIDILKDFSYAWRISRKSPGLTTLALLTLAIGVGASIALYAVGESVLLRSLPYPHPERLVSISAVHVRGGESGVGQEDFRDWQASNSVFERMAYTEFSQMTLTGFGDAERITGSAVSEGFFELMGVAPMFGQWFTPEEQKPGGDYVVMLSHAFWVRKLGARTDVVGTTIAVGDRAYRIAGVMPASFRFHSSEYWTPIRHRNHGRQQHQYGAYARLRPGVSVQAAQTQMTEIARRIENQFPQTNSGWGVRVVGMRSAFLGELAQALLVFAAAVLIVLLVGCGNVASLLLARGIARSKEIAVRIALGAGRRRVMRLLLVESLLLSGLGAAGGLVLAAWLLRLAVAAAPPGLELGAILTVSPTLVLFAIALTIATGLLTGLWPALRGSRVDVLNDLKESSNSLVAGRAQERTLNGLVIGEIALAVVLLTFAGLLVKSFVGLLRVDLGYRSDHVLTVRLPLGSSRNYRTDEALLRFAGRLLPQLGALPGVTSVAAASAIPMGGTYSGSDAQVEGQPDNRDWADASTRLSRVTPGYFQTMGIAFRSGRDFTEADTLGSEPVAIVNEAFVRKMMPGQNPIGRRVRIGRGKWQRIVGVVADSRYSGPSQAVPPEHYTVYAQDPWMEFVVLRTAVPETSVIAGVRGVIRGIDRELAISQVRTVRQSLELSTLLEREVMALVGGFAVVTLLMATLGLGGVMAYTVSRRRRDIGLRMALGACSRDVWRAVIANAARLVCIGAATGVTGAFAGARLLESMLYGVRPRDPLVLAAAPAVLAAVALLACAVPAYRAASLDPMAALREE